MSFDDFVGRVGPRLRAALVAAHGPQVGNEAASEALAYAWEHWVRLEQMENPAGYLYRVGQTAARRSRRPQGFLPPPRSSELPDFEPALLPALEALSDLQRVCVVMVHAYGWTQTEVAELLDVTPSTVRTHLARGLSRLRQQMEVAHHGD